MKSFFLTVLFTCSFASSPLSSLPDDIYSRFDSLLAPSDLANIASTSRSFRAQVFPLVRRTLRGSDVLRFFNLPAFREDFLRATSPETPLELKFDAATCFRFRKYGDFRQAMMNTLRDLTVEEGYTRISVSLDMTAFDMSHRNPVVDLEEMEALAPWTTRLILNNNRVRNFQAISSFNNLEELRIRFLVLTEPVESIDWNLLSDLRRLETLDVSMNACLESLDWLRPLSRSSLKSLDISGTRVNDLTPLAELKEIRRVRLPRGVADYAHALRGLEKLREVLVGDAVVDLGLIRTL